MQRGVALDKSELGKLAEGKTFSSSGFWSTTTSPDVAEGFSLPKPGGAGKQQAVLHISQKSGVSLMGRGFDDEKEILIPHGTRFRVERHEKRGSVHHIYLTEQ